MWSDGVIPFRMKFISFNSRIWTVGRSIHWTLLFQGFPFEMHKTAQSGQKTDDSMQISVQEGLRGCPVEQNRVCGSAQRLAKVSNMSIAQLFQMNTTLFSSIQSGLWLSFSHYTLPHVILLGLLSKVVAGPCSVPVAAEIFLARTCPDHPDDELV